MSSIKCISCGAKDTELYLIFDDDIYYCEECAKKYNLNIDMGALYINDQWEVF